MPEKITLPQGYSHRYTATVQEPKLTREIDIDCYNSAKVSAENQNKQIITEKTTKKEGVGDGLPTKSIACQNTQAVGSFLMPLFSSPTVKIQYFIPRGVPLAGGCPAVQILWIIEIPEHLAQGNALLRVFFPVKTAAYRADILIDAVLLCPFRLNPINVFP